MLFLLFYCIFGFCAIYIWGLSFQIGPNMYPKISYSACPSVGIDLLNGSRIWSVRNRREKWHFYCHTSFFTRFSGPIQTNSSTISSLNQTKGVLSSSSLFRIQHCLPVRHRYRTKFALIPFTTQSLVLSARRLNCRPISSCKTAGPWRRILPPNWNSQPQNVGLIWTLTLAAYLPSSCHISVSSPNLS